MVSTLTVFVISTLVKILLVVGVLLGLVAYAVLAERKVSAAMQDRIGPNRVGLPFLQARLMGLGQPLADAFKLMLKEQFVPGHVRGFYYNLAPILAFLPALLAICVIPFAGVDPIRLPGLSVPIPQPGVIANVGIGALLLFAVTSLGVYGIVLAGWSSNSKYAFLGGIRSSAQMISYEVALGFSAIPIFLISGGLSLPQIVDFQIERGWFLFPFVGKQIDWHLLLFWPSLLISSLIFLVTLFAETNRAPFDLPESEQELVGGYNTEYGGMRFGMFFLGEYAALISASGLFVTLFLGGWSLPFGWLSTSSSLGTFLLQALVFLVKVCALVFFFMWIRWTLPRFRYDQVMTLGWKFLLPISMVNIVVVAILLAVFGGTP
ncbi:NADH-quinone oxidoreductase subunit H [Methylacidimicrobium cyclopophantes]|uniref:NADH-quinone oxidoreductase subunit H n=1 Tax=Methylacidimicrobium cyclopophantes TaxID=1041766 RepID=A0A5E6M688_9BACT|nr:complex I subunit 1 family protein [Methylacidimicrobium cyclopophantes]VVM05064.1 NADH-quinone oxidoreductase subunit H [Methylacidimicrobium cyclopophantes]